MIAFIRRHRVAVGLAAVVCIGLLVFVLVWFQPQKLVIETRVNEAAPEVTPAVTAKPLQGAFQSFEHPTTGRAVVVGGSVLRLENFRTSNGPDVVVYLSAAFPRSIGDDAVARDFVDLGALKGNIGNQNYTIPAGTDLARYSTVVVWCRRFKVSFGATRLT